MHWAERWRRRLERWLHRPIGVKIVRVEGPLELVDGRWLMRIPLEVGGRELSRYAVSISNVRGDFLEVELPPKLVQNLKIKAGQHLWVTNRTGEFTFEWEHETAT